MNDHDPGQIFDELETLLAPQGIKTVTTGTGEIGQLFQARYHTTDREEVLAAWKRNLRGIATARAVVIGVPSDAGAGFERGSFKGPLAIRNRLLQAGIYDEFARCGIVDLGDVRVNPHLISDDLLSDEAKASVRRSRGWTDDRLPVSPHSILLRTLHHLYRLRPGLHVVVLGGDHGISWIPIAALTDEGQSPCDDLGILHIDAHTDLLSERDGVIYNFATWAYHANDAIGRNARLQQFGIRVSGRDRSEWERDLGVRQWWANEIAQDPERVIDEAISIWQAAGVRRLYVSNDIDGTDPRWASSTGTLEPNGLTPDFVLTLIRRANEVFPIIGSDLVEVAPPLKKDVPGEPHRTVDTACAYLLAQLQAAVPELDACIGVPAPLPPT